METTYTSNSESETAQIATDFAKTLNEPKIICLYGTLGIGKSVFARNLIRTLCDNATLEVPSPTFTLVQTYENEEYPIYHFDLYRLQDPEELYELGWEEALQDSIALIEWPEKMGTLKPSKTLDIIFKPVQNNNSSRIIEIKA